MTRGCMRSRSTMRARWWRDVRLFGIRNANCRQRQGPAMTSLSKAVLEDYFSLQLAFSKQYASKARVTLSGAVDRCTNLRRRLGLTGSAGESHWRNLLACVDRSALVDDDAVLTMCSALYA